MNMEVNYDRVKDLPEETPPEYVIINGSTSSLQSYIASVIGIEQTENLYWLDTNDLQVMASKKFGSHSGVANRVRINDIRRINKYFEYLNRETEPGSYLVAAVETKEARKERIFNKYPALVSRPYYVLDFLLKRALPKWKMTRKIYFHITKGRNRVISISEALGRLICCGYSIIDYKQIDYNTWIIAKKVKEPAYDMQPTYGGMVRLPRIGKGGDVIKVHKIRTMYPYSEYLPEYVYDNYDVDKSGKFTNDFRNTSYGYFFRKYWLDEFPMFINFFRGEMKLVGVRPLSLHYYELYPEDLQKLRVKVKPGLIPPYYADLPCGLEEIQESERKYLKAYLEKPIKTDIRYFFMIFYNIIFGGARSK